MSIDRVLAAFGAVGVVWLMMTITGTGVMRDGTTPLRDVVRDAARGSALIVGFLILAAVTGFTFIGLAGYAAGAWS